MMTCHECQCPVEGGTLSTKQLVSLNKKLLGRKIKHCFCEDCLAEYVGQDKDDFPQMIEDFKNSGCALF